MVHLNITFPEELKSRLDREVKHEKTKRSTLIQKAVTFYLEVKSRKSTQELLREGYQAMGNESRKMMNDFKDIDRESLKYVD